MRKVSDIVSLAMRMKNALEDNWLSELELLNLHVLFRPIYKQNLTLLNQNAIVCYCILAYSEDSPWIYVRKDRRQNKEEILTGLGVDPKNRIYREILDYENDGVQQVILSYLLFHVDARVQEIISLLEYANKNILFANQKTSDKQKTGESKDNEGQVEDQFKYLDQSEIAKVNKEKGELLLKALELRAKAEELMKKMENDYQKTDHATVQDFGFAFSDARKFDITRWEHRIRRRKEQTP